MPTLKQILARNPSLKKINALVASPKKKAAKASLIKSKPVSKAKEFIEATLTSYCQQEGYTLLTEHRFDTIRKFRFDWAIEELNIAFEYEGIVCGKSRHTTLTGFTNDCKKYNLAQMLGWDVYRYTALNYKDIELVLNKNPQCRNTRGE